MPQSCSYVHHVYHALHFVYSQDSCALLNSAADSSRRREVSLLSRSLICIRILRKYRAKE